MIPGYERLIKETESEGPLCQKAGPPVLDRPGQDFGTRRHQCPLSRRYVWRVRYLRREPRQLYQKGRTMASNGSDYCEFAGAFLFMNNC